MACQFGEMFKEGMILNELGEIAYTEWIKLADRFDCFELDVFQIMPNHMHGIIVLKDDVNVGATLAVAQTLADNPLERAEDISEKAQTIERVGASPASTAVTTEKEKTTTTSIADIIGAYKSLVSNACLEIFKSKNKTMGKLWQRNYYDHIIRDERAYQNISHYIINNPKKWYDDKFYKKR